MRWKKRHILPVWAIVGVVQQQHAANATRALPPRAPELENLPEGPLSGGGNENPATPAGVIVVPGSSAVLADAGIIPRGAVTAEGQPLDAKWFSAMVEPPAPTAPQSTPSEEQVEAELRKAEASAGTGQGGPPTAAGGGDNAFSAGAATSSGAKAAGGAAAGGASPAHGVPGAVGGGGAAAASAGSSGPEAQNGSNGSNDGGAQESVSGAASAGGEGGVGANALLGLGAAAVAGAAAAGGALSNLSLPAISVPEISLPGILEVSLPDISMPHISVPDISMPHISAPHLSVPHLAFPDVHLTVPHLSLDSVLPDVDVAGGAAALTREAEAVLRKLPSPEELVKSVDLSKVHIPAPDVKASLAAAAPAVTATLAALPVVLLGGAAVAGATAAAAARTAEVAAMQTAVTTLTGVKNTMEEGNEAAEYTRQTQPPMITFRLKKLTEIDSADNPILRAAGESTTVAELGQQVAEMQRQLSDMDARETGIVATLNAWPLQALPDADPKGRPPDILAALSLEDSLEESTAMGLPAIISRKFAPTVKDHFEAAPELLGSRDDVGPVERSSKLVPEIVAQEAEPFALQSRVTPYEEYRLRKRQTVPVLRTTKKAVRNFNDPLAGAVGDD